MEYCISIFIHSHRYRSLDLKLNGARFHNNYCNYKIIIILGIGCGKKEHGEKFLFI